MTGIFSHLPPYIVPFVTHGVLFVSMCNARIVNITAAAAAAVFVDVAVVVWWWLFFFCFVIYFPFVCIYIHVCIQWALSHTHTLTVYTQLTSTNLDAYQKIFIQFATNTYTILQSNDSNNQSYWIPEVGCFTEKLWRNFAFFTRQHL